MALSRGEITINEEHRTKHAIFEGAARAKGSAVETFMTVDEFTDLGLSEVSSQLHVGFSCLSVPPLPLSFFCVCIHLPTRGGRD